MTREVGVREERSRSAARGASEGGGKGGTGQLKGAASGLDGRLTVVFYGLFEWRMKKSLLDVTGAQVKVF